MHTTNKPRLSIIVPCYNEEECIISTNMTLLSTLNDLIQLDLISEDSYILYVDDGSLDSTWQHISSFIQESHHVNGIKLARNVGHQHALTAGLIIAKEHCDLSISIDADLQDDVCVMEDMINHYYNGCDLVYGVRKDRSSDKLFKKISAQTYYRILNIMKINAIYNHADYRLMSVRAMNAFSQYKEVNLFLRGIVTSLGYKSHIVHYTRKKRTLGISKYPFNKMLGLAIDGITSFSIKPLSIITMIGFSIILISIFAAIYSLISYVTGNVEAGWTSLILSIWFLGGTQLLSIGILGQYIGKIYMETKQRPRYNIEYSSLSSTN